MVSFLGNRYIMDRFLFVLLVVPTKCLSSSDDIIAASVFICCRCHLYMRARARVCVDVCMQMYGRVSFINSTFLSRESSILIEYTFHGLSCSAQYTHIYKIQINRIQTCHSHPQQSFEALIITILMVGIERIEIQCWLRRCLNRWLS